jgi:dephospho-CoA kinase
MKVIGFCGLPGSGKSTAIEAIRDLGVVITMGDVIRNEAIKRNVNLINDENLGKIAKEFRKTYGPQIIAEISVDLIKSQKAEVVFIDGVRSMAEANIFRKIWKFPIIAIVLDAKFRFKRLYERNRSDDPKDIEEFKERDNRERDFGLDAVVEKADYKIENTSSKEQLKKKTREIVKKIIDSIT